MPERPLRDPYDTEAHRRAKEMGGRALTGGYRQALALAYKSMEAEEPETGWNGGPEPRGG